ncbi:GntR family transcriptional regulator [Hoeflea sp. YIM 152468]|uniref:GntR family transcriptional regulator n=1 Tax=Hoeflea sp. YIM 152468 TaxID=3031759 RepID=UPI0023DB7AE1|nr:GntR family transcriptional regulator [Hoeflea sp. YIM 152468]MDF1608877.1 GntR family transcriptional regulator [Hoeflea sp. YIM 152468]
MQQKARQVLDLGIAVGPQLYRLLRARIIRNEIEPGVRISESEIAAQYSISRQPVREAFIKLAEEGLVEIRPQRGTFVHRITTAAVMDARFVREAIEADIAGYLATHADEAVIKMLRQEIEKQKRALNDVNEFMELDDRFHALLAEAAGKIRVWKMVEGLKSQMDRVRHLAMLRFPASKLVSQHSAIVEAIASADPEAAIAAMRGHLREILNDLPEIAESNPQFFEEKPQWLLPEDTNPRRNL